MEVGARGKPYHFTGAAFTVHEGKVLLVKHHKLLRWLPPGGHIEKDARGDYIESPEECAIREALEETGLRIELVGGGPEEDAPPERLPLRVPVRNHIHAIDEAHDHFAFEYFARLKPGQDLARASGDEQCRWFSRTELKRNAGREFEGARMTEDIALCAIRALDALAGQGR